MKIMRNVIPGIADFFRRTSDSWRRIGRILMIICLMFGSFYLGSYLTDLEITIKCMNYTEDIKNGCSRQIGINEGKCKMMLEYLNSQIGICKDELNKEQNKTRKE